MYIYFCFFCNFRIIFVCLQPSLIAFPKSPKNWNAFNRKRKGNFIRFISSSAHSLSKPFIQPLLQRHLNKNTKKMAYTHAATQTNTTFAPIRTTFALHSHTIRTTFAPHSHHIHTHSHSFTTCPHCVHTTFTPHSKSLFGENKCGGKTFFFLGDPPGVTRIWVRVDTRMLAVWILFSLLKGAA